MGEATEKAEKELLTLATAELDSDQIEEAEERVERERETRREGKADEQRS